MVRRTTVYDANPMFLLIPFKKIASQERILRMMTRLTVMMIFMMIQLTLAVLRSGVNSLGQAIMILKALNKLFVRQVLNVDVSRI